MIGLGTLLNVAGVVAGGAAGLVFRSQLTPRLQESLVRALGLVCLFIGVCGTVEKAVTVEGGTLHAGGTFMMIGAFVIGTLLGTWADLDGAMVRFGQALERRFASRPGAPGGSGDANFVRGFVVTSLTISIGAMAVVGSIADGISGDVTILTAKAVMDAVITAALAASLGRGCVFAAIPLAILQGSITVLAHFIAPWLTNAAISNIAFIGSMMIFCVGVNLIWGDRFKVADMLPALVVAALWAYL